MIVDRDMAQFYDVEKFFKDIYNIENQHLNIIYDPHFDRIMERLEYEKTVGLMEWECAICGDSILVDKNRGDVENFVCENCRENYNNNSPLVDRRIMDSRTRLFKYIEDRLYEELEDCLKGGR